MGLFRDATSWLFEPQTRDSWDGTMSDRIKPPKLQPADPSAFVSPREAMQLIAVTKAVKVISNSLMQLGVKVYDGKIESTDDELPLIIRKPSKFVSRAAFIQGTATSLAMSGNAYWLVGRPSKRAPADTLQLLPPDSVQPKGDAFGFTTSLTYNNKVYSPDEIKHLKLTQLFGEVVGAGPLQLATGSVRSALDAERYANKFTKRGGQVNGVLSSDSQKLDAATAQRYKEQFVETTSLENGPALLGHGFKYQRIGLTPEELQFLSIREYDTSQIARLFGLEMAIMEAPIKSQSLTYQNVEQAYLKWIKSGLMDYLIAIENAYSDVLPEGRSVKLNLDALLRADTKGRADVHVQALGPNGWATLDERRGIEGLPPATPEQREEIFSRRKSIDSFATSPSTDEEAPRQDNKESYDDPND